MTNINFQRVAAILTMAASVLLATACGGGGTSVAGVGSGGTGIVNGTVTKGPINNATVTAYGVKGGLMGAVIGTTTTDASGNFTMNIGTYSGPVVLQASGGKYIDEATGATMTTAAGDVMTAVMPTVAAGTGSAGIQVTPVTTMAHALAKNMDDGMTYANISAANSAMGNYFSISDILHVQPMNPLTPGSGMGASQDSRNYGMTLAAMSQYAKKLGMSVSSSIVTAMMNDASDRMMDGKKHGVQISMSMGGSHNMSPTAGTSDLARAMTEFMHSGKDVSGLTATDMAPLVEKLTKSTGKI